MNYLYLPFIVQSVLMGIDESIHKRRGLEMWERLGHPLDTLTVFVPLSMIAINEYSERLQTIYIILSVFSCLFITKDEFVHSKQCSPVEHWIHALLFVLHPVIFLSSGIIWKYHPENDFLSLQACLIGVFMVYQILRWSIQWKR